MVKSKLEQAVSKVQKETDSLEDLVSKLNAAITVRKYTVNRIAKDIREMKKVRININQAGVSTRYVDAIILNMRGDYKTHCEMLSNLKERYHGAKEGIYLNNLLLKEVGYVGEIPGSAI